MAFSITGGGVERELLVTGIGGQGVQLATQVLARALTLENRYVMSLGTYGGTMRGGNTDASLVYADQPISAPPIVTRAWSGLAMHHRFWESMHTRLQPGAVLLVNSPIFDPSIDLSAFSAFEVPAVEIATAQGSPLAAAMVMIGAYAGATGAVSVGALEQAIEQSLPSYRRQLLEVNVAALRAGHARFLSIGRPAWEAMEVA
jgi:Pyruvate/2-oxoacid:ferredoxin oxidoreductase gamma subunit